MSDHQAMKYAEVLVNLPVDRPFTYAIPDGAAVTRGTRVRVPFRDKLLGGFVVRITDQKPSFDAKPIQEIGEVLVDDRLFELARWIAERYCCSWGEALEAALPTGVKRQHPGKWVTIASLDRPPDEPPKPARQRRAIERLRSGPQDVREIGGTTVAQALMKKGWITLKRVRGEVDILSDVVREAAKNITLTPEQKGALEGVFAGPRVTLLHGVTGSGKTEVYLRAIARVVAEGRQAIVLVPEIALTPQTVSRFKARFPRVAVLHSVLTESDRATQWRATRAGEADVIIGARSAVFAPAKSLGLIVIDEEHDGAYKQDSTPRYHAREVAIRRAELEGARVLLGSATPALESIHAARSGAWRLERLPWRIERREMPEIEVVDMMAEKADIKRWPILSRRLLSRIEEALKKGEQTLLFLNRRGYVTQITCPRCKWIFRCRRCEVTLTYHKETDQALCHYCLDSRKVPETCPDCKLGGLLRFGLGTERLAEEVKTRFPERTVARMDSDSMRTRKDYRDSLNGLWSGKTDILIGTQMIAKGLDVPNVTVVGVVNADTAFHVPDFRASERTFQLITQVAGRAGRGPRGGRVVVQTFNPNHYSIQSASAYDFDGFVARELAMRRDLDYPPFRELVRVVVAGTNEKQVVEQTQRLSEKLKERADPSIKILGPAPAPIYRLKGRFRKHLLIKVGDLSILRPLLLKHATHLSGRVHATIDVDPVNMM